MKIAYLIILFLMFIIVFLLGAIWGQKRINKKINNLLDEFEKEVK